MLRCADVQIADFQWHPTDPFTMMSVSENDQLPEFRQGGILAIKGLQYLCSQFGIDEERMKFLLQYVFRYIHAKMEDGKSLKEIEHLMLGKDVE